MRSTEKSPSWGGIRLSVLIAAVAAFLLVPAAQAFANGTVTVNVAGEGSGEVSSAGGYRFQESNGTEIPSGLYEGGPPPIECAYESPGPATGTCETTLTSEEGLESIAVYSIPKPGSKLAGWEIEAPGAILNFCNAESEVFPGSRSECIVQSTSGNVEITAFFEKEESESSTFPLTVAPEGTGEGTVTSTPAGINCGSECEAEFAEGEEVELSQSAETGSEFTGWSGACSGTGTCKVTMSEAKEVKATFDLEPEPEEFALEVNTDGTGEGEVSCKAGAGPVEPCEAEYLEGTKVTLVPEAETGSEFSGWSEDCTGSGACEVTMSANKSVTATFDLEPTPEFELEVKTAGTGEGEVSCEVNSGPVEPCEALYEEGTEVALVPEAETGSEFVQWSEDCTGTGACELTMDEAHSVTATFDEEEEPEPEEFNLTIVKAGTGSGSVTCNAGACASSYEEGTEVTLAASAASGSTFTGWSGGGCSGTGICKVTINADTTVTATFTANPKPEETCATNASLCPSPPPPAETKCVVPRLAKKTLGQAKSALKAAHCALGKVTKPKKKGALVVKSSKPGVGTILADGAKVALKLGPKPKKKK